MTWDAAEIIWDVLVGALVVGLLLFNNWHAEKLRKAAKKQRDHKPSDH